MPIDPARNEDDELLELLRTFEVGQITNAACAGEDPEVYHPELGPPSPAILNRCSACPARLPCLALALHAEPPDNRFGWYGGMGPSERDGLALRLKLVGPKSPDDDRAVEAERLRSTGMAVNEIATAIGCCRRTVQRYLHPAA